MSVVRFRPRPPKEFLAAARPAVAIGKKNEKQEEQQTEEKPSLRAGLFALRAAGAHIP
ncbi:hypothetical protein ACXIUT_03885 [Achromobacter denitrificans]